MPYQNLYMNVHSSIIDQKWTQLKYPSTDEWTFKMWYIHTNGILFGIKKEVLLHTITWMNPENMLNERI